MALTAGWPRFLWDCSRSIDHRSQARHEDERQYERLLLRDKQLLTVATVIRLIVSISILRLSTR